MKQIWTKKYNRNIIAETSTEQQITHSFRPVIGGGVFFKIHASNGGEDEKPKPTKQPLKSF